MTTGRINQVTIVNANKGPLWRLPLVAQRKRFFVTVVMALSPASARRPRLVRRRQEQPPRRGRRSHSWLPLSPSRFPRALSVGTRLARARKVPPRRPKRRPHLGTSAIQRPSGGRCLLLLVFQAWPAASHPQSPSSGAEQTNPPTPSGIPLARATASAGGDVWFKL